MACIRTSRIANSSQPPLAGYLAEKPDLTMTVNRADLEQVMTGETKLEALLADGRAKVEGDVGILGKLAGLMVEFDPRFEIMPGTKLRTEQAAANPYKAAIGAGVPE